MAGIRIRAGFAFPPEIRTFASPTETKVEWEQRAQHYFWTRGWELIGVETADITLSLDRDVKSVKTMGNAETSRALNATLATWENLWAQWTRPMGVGGGPDTLVVEIQHNANAEMRGVSLVIMSYYQRSWPTRTNFSEVTGTHKLKVCDALGVHVGDGLAHQTAKRDKKRAESAAKKEAKQRKSKKQKVGPVDPRRSLLQYFGMPSLTLAPPPPMAPLRTTVNPGEKDGGTGTVVAKPASSLKTKGVFAETSVVDALFSSSSEDDIVVSGSESEDWEEATAVVPTAPMPTSAMPHSNQKNGGASAESAPVSLPTPPPPPPSARGRGWRGGRGGRGGRAGWGSWGRGRGAAPGSGETDGEDKGPHDDGPGSRKDSASKYADNKLRAVLACERLRVLWAPAQSPPIPATVLAKLVDHNVADALLQGLWVLWGMAKTQAKLRAPRKVSVRKPSAAKPRKKPTPVVVACAKTTEDPVFRSSCGSSDSGSTSSDSSDDDEDGS